MLVRIEGRQVVRFSQVVEMSPEEFARLDKLSGYELDAALAPWFDVSNILDAEDIEETDLYAEEDPAT